MVSAESSTPTRARLAADAFRALFGEPLDLWIADIGRWERAVSEPDADGDLRARIAPETLPDPAGEFRRPHVVELGPGLLRIELLLELPCAAPDGPSLAVGAVGTVAGSAQTLAEALVRCSHRNRCLAEELRELQGGLAPHLEQISRDFEQLNWLRRLGGESNLADLGHSLLELVGKILPDLCELVRAEGLALVGAVHPADGGTRPGAVQFWAGRQVLDDDRCAQLVEALPHPHDATLPVVRNHLHLEPDFDWCHEVRSCLKVPVTYRGSFHGWLIAFNRVPWEINTEDLIAFPPGMYEDEFGTNDAGLMTSAAAAIAAHARNLELFRDKETLLIGIIRSLVNTLDARDAYTCGHSDRVATMAKIVGRKIELPDAVCESLYMSGLLHDIGKIGIPDEVLHKPGRLTEEEFAIIKKHPVIGHAILSHLPQLRHVLPGVLHHHEAYDGSGYPHGLAGEEIPLFGRILAVVDSYDAMTSSRPYRTAMPAERAEKILREGAGTQWDPQLIQVFFDVLPTIKANCSDSRDRINEMLRTPEESAAEAEDQDRIAHAIALTNV